MVIKHVALDIVCGITSILPEMKFRKLHLQENQMLASHP